MDQPKIAVAFVITGFDCHPDEVSQVIGVSPTDTWQIGDPIRPPEIRQKSNGWRLRSPLGESQHLEPHLRWLLDHLPDEISELPSTSPWSIDVSCAIVIGEHAPSMTLPRDVLERFARLRADLDIDVILA